MDPSGIVEQPSWQAEEGAERIGARSAGKWERCGETERFYEHVTFSSANAQSRSPSAVDGRMVMRRVGAQFRNDGGACTIEVEMLMCTAVRATGPTQRVEDYHR